MGDLVLNEGSVCIKEEVTEGTYLEESSAASFIEVLEEGFEIVPNRALVERNLRTSTVETVASRLGTKGVSGSIPIEFKAGATAGAAPRQEPLLKALLGGKRSSAEITTQTGHTTSILEVDDANGTAEVSTVTFETKADSDSGDFLLFRSQDNTTYAAAIDLTGSDDEPTSSKWLSIPTTQRVMVDISGATDAASVAALFETAIDTLATGDITTDDAASNGTLVFTQDTAGIIADTQGRTLDSMEDYAAASETDGSSGITWATGTAGVNSDIQKLHVGDIILIKEAVHHISPILSKDSDSITLLVARATSFSDSVKIEAFTTYYHDTANASTLSITEYVGGKKRKRAYGCRVVSAELGGYATGTALEMTYAFEGLGYAFAVGYPLYTPSYDEIYPPVALKAKIYKDGTEVIANEFTLSISNTLGFKTSTGSDNGKLASRITKQSISGTVNPYMEDDNADIFNDLFEDGDSFSLFAHAQNDLATNTFQNIVGIYLPLCKLPEVTTGDQEGLATDAMSFTAHKDNGYDSIFISCI